MEENKKKKQQHNDDGNETDDFDYSGSSSSRISNSLSGRSDDYCQSFTTIVVMLLL